MISCVATILFTLPLTAQPPSLLKTVDDHYNHLKSLRCRYVESYSGMGITRFEYGTLTLKKPGLMRWSYDKPTGKVFILDGHYAWFYTPGDAQVQRIPAKQMDDLRTRSACCSAIPSSPKNSTTSRSSPKAPTSSALPASPKAWKPASNASPSTSVRPAASRR